MTRHAYRAPDYVEHLIKAVDRIQKYILGKTHDEFLADELVQDAVVCNFEILGEASNKLREVLPDAVTRFPEIPFGKMYGTRNNLAQGYSLIDYEILWDTIQKRLPALRVALTAALESLRSIPPPP